MEEISIPSKIKVRSPVVAGLFYPDDKNCLEARLRSLGIECGGDAAAIIAPHGAWEFSGHIAGSAFLSASGRTRKRKDGKGISRVVLLGTIHTHPEEQIFLSDSSFFETPLGNLPVDLETEEELASCSTLFEINDIPHLREHSLEVLLPFIQFCFPDTAIVPILMGSSRISLVSALARALHIVFEPLMDQVLFVVSSNLSKNRDENIALIQARECIRLLEENETGKFVSGMYDGRISACGASLIAALLESGILNNREVRLLTEPMGKAYEDGGQTVYYGGVSFT
ncbi:MAG: AmmeMemoRadiSam system protein B [Treponema sp.]|jgi:AmmeMemoRadiSam system protein B|nr:AmmeMemoRadiSam system protein B [Treponema sp.]